MKYEEKVAQALRDLSLKNDEILELESLKSQAEEEIQKL